MPANVSVVSDISRSHDHFCNMNNKMNDLPFVVPPNPFEESYDLHPLLSSTENIMNPSYQPSADDEQDDEEIVPVDTTDAKEPEEVLEDDDDFDYEAYYCISDCQDEDYEDDYVFFAKDIINENDDDEYHLYNYKQQKVLRRKQSNKKEKHSSTHFHVNGHRHALQEYRQSIIEDELERHKNKNPARWQSPFGSGSMYGSSSSAPAPSSSSSRRKPRGGDRIQTNFQTDQELQAAIQASMNDMAHVAGDAFSRAQIELLAQLQTRDLSPEDYELLLLLDSTVKPKTLTASDINRFPKRDFHAPEGTAHCSSSSEMCSVCMCEYEQGDTITKLPCGHEFHTPCITQWLCNSSVNCPCDGLPVQT